MDLNADRLALLDDERLVAVARNVKKKQLRCAHSFEEQVEVLYERNEDLPDLVLVLANRLEEVVEELASFHEGMRGMCG